MELLLLVACAVALAVVWVKKAALQSELSALRARYEAERQGAEAAAKARDASHAQAISSLRSELDELQQYRGVQDAAQECARLQQEGQDAKAAAIAEATALRSQAATDSRERRERAEALLASASSQASQIIADAKKQAEQIAGDAYRALKEVDLLKETATAMRNVIDGYGDRYLKPSFSMLDELAEAYGFAEAGQQLKAARERTRLLLERGGAAACDYVEANRRSTAIRFVIDAFNGKVDSILTRTKSDNVGTLERQVLDAWALVNSNGAAFRSARITEEYLLARLDELKWAAAAIAIRDREREEQRAIKDQLREEERARREIERALKEAAKEEEALQRAMEKVREQVAKANDEQRAKYEAELQQLQVRLSEAEERNRRAMSMAQQTRAGHVYIISNIGSFGENVYKIGMTRRLEPIDRIRELGDASVPFAFDVHAMIWSDDAPSLETALHREFVVRQVNKVNPRKEFFRVDLAAIRSAIEARGHEVSWTVTAAAAEYRESLAIEARLATDPSLATAWLRQQEAAEAQLAAEAVLSSEPLVEQPFAGS